MKIDFYMITTALSFAYANVPDIDRSIMWSKKLDAGKTNPRGIRTLMTRSGEQPSLHISVGREIKNYFAKVKRDSI